MKLVRKRLSWFKPDPGNPRQHPREQLEKLEAAIRRFGFRFPVVADASGHLIAGHGRLEAARRAGLAEVPCIVLEDVDEPTREALALLDNRIPLDASWDETLLLEKIRKVVEGGHGLTPADLGLDPGEVDRLEKALAASDADAAPIVDASDLHLRFVAVVSGPIEAQPEALRILERLRELEGVEVEVSTEARPA